MKTLTQKKLLNYKRITFAILGQRAILLGLPVFFSLYFSIWGKFHQNVVALPFFLNDCYFSILSII